MQGLAGPHCLVNMALNWHKAAERGGSLLACGRNVLEEYFLDVGGREQAWARLWGGAAGRGHREGEGPLQPLESQREEFTCPTRGRQEAGFSSWL